MTSLAKFIYNLDKAIFQWLRELVGGTFLDDWTVLSGIWVFWTPLMIFLGVMIWTGRKEQRFLNLFFFVAAFILSYQAATLLSMVFVQPAPYVVENILHGRMLPAFSPEYSFNLPDWTTAAIVASLHFARLRLRGTRSPLPSWIGIVVPLLILSRIIPGFAYPVDTLVGALLGSLIGFFMHQFARSVEIVLKKPA